MRCLAMARPTRESESGALSDAPILAEMGRFNEALMQAGVLLAAEGLKPGNQGTRGRFDDGRRQVIDGPFAKTRKLIAGFWLWQALSVDEALKWMQRCLPPFDGTCDIGLRPRLETRVTSARR